MSPSFQVKEILIPGVIMLALDAVFLYSTRNIVLPVYQSIQGAPVSIRYGSAIVCYIFMTLGLYYFIIREKRSPVDAFLLGMFVYGVYDTTVLTVFQKYTPAIAIMDIIWGGILFGTTTLLYNNITKM